MIRPGTELAEVISILRPLLCAGYTNTLDTWTTMLVLTCQINRLGTIHEYKYSIWVLYYTTLAFSRLIDFAQRDQLWRPSRPVSYWRWNRPPIHNKSTIPIPIPNSKFQIPQIACALAAKPTGPLLLSCLYHYASPIESSIMRRVTVQCK